MHGMHVFGYPYFGYEWGGTPGTGAPPPPPPDVSSFYGVQPGQIPMHLNLSDADANGDGVISNAENLGGAGAAFNVNSMGGPIAKEGDWAVMTADDYLKFTTKPDMAGTRLVMAADLSQNGVFQYLAGSSGGGVKSNIRIDPAGDVVLINRNAGSWVTTQGAINPPITPGARLYEFDFYTGGDIVLTVNRVERARMANPFAVYDIDWFGAGQNTNGAGITGKLGNVYSIIHGGNFDQAADAVARSLNSRYNLGIDL